MCTGAGGHRKVMNGHDAASQKARAGAHAGHVHGSAKPLQNGFSCTDVCTETEVRRGMRITFKASLPRGCSLPPSREADILLVKQPLPMWMELSARDKHTLR